MNPEVSLPIVGRKHQGSRPFARVPLRASFLGAVTLFCLAGYPAAALANWVPSLGGTYEYTATGNWSGGTIDGNFSGAIAGTQTITFNQDWELTTNGLRFTYTSPQDFIFQSNSTTARTLSFAAANSVIGIGSNGQGDGTAMRTVTLGTSSNPLILDLGSGNFTRTLRPGNNTNFLVNARITGGHESAWLAIEGKTSATAGSISLTNDASDFISNLSITAARPLIVSSMANAGVASAIGAGSVIRFNNGSRADFQYTGAAASTNRTIELASGAVHIFNEGTGKLTFTGAFTRTASSNVELRFAGTQDIEVTGAIADSTGAGALSLSKMGTTGTLTLSGTDNAFTGGVDATQGWVEFATVRNAGIHSSLGADGAIRLGSMVNPSLTAQGGLRYLGSQNSSTDRELQINQAAIHNDGGGALAFTGVVTVTGNGQRTLTLGGTHTGYNLIAGDISDGNGTDAVRSLVKEGAGRWVLEGNNSYSGTTTVEEGVLLIKGTHTGTGMMDVVAGAAIGGDGKIAGGLTLAAGANFVFSLTETLTVDGSVWLDSSFGVANLLGLDESTPLGIYTLIDSLTTNFELLDLQNWGMDNAFDLGNGKLAYFQEGSLQLAVIPEPGVAGLIGASTLLLAMIHRRRKSR